MKTNISVLIVTLASLTAACSEPFTLVDRPDTGPDCCPSELKGPDAEPGADAKPAVDANNTIPDGGSDTGTGCCDSGKDANTTPDANNTPDAGNDANVDQDSGPTPDGGNDADPDGGTFPDAGGCTTNETTCAGNRPLICSNNAWSSNGGACNYGCSVGACSCSAPSGRFVNGPAGVLKDTTTGLSWWTWTGEGSGVAITYASAESICTTFDMRLPTKEELLTIVAEVSPNTFCSPFDADPVFQTKFGLKSDWYFTTTRVSGHPTSRYVVSFKDGRSERDYLADGGTPNSERMYICVSP
jgi:hypothetical protein